MKKKQVKKNQTNQLTKLLLTMAVVFVMALVTGTVSKAAQGQVTGLKQTDAGTNSVTVSWDTLLDPNIEYDVYIASEKNGNYVYEGTSFTLSQDIITGLNAGRTYWVKVQAKIEGKNGSWGPESEPLEVVTIPDSDPEEIKHVGSTYTSVTLSWPEVAGANTYEVEYWEAASENASVKVTTNTPSVELTGLLENKEYSVFVKAGRMNSTGTFVEYSRNAAVIYRVPVQPTKVTGLDVLYYWEYSYTLEIECDQNVAADGYEWELHTAYNKKDKRLKASDSSSSYIFLKHSALKKHNFYKIRVRAYSLDSNNKKYYSKWSSWKYTCSQPDMKLKKTSGGIKASWDKIKGADRYVVYASTKQKSGYKKIATTKSTSKVISKINKKALKSGKTYYFYVEAQNKVGKKYYSGEAGNQLSCWKIKY